jgi:nucleolar GTP-binding protein
LVQQKDENKEMRQPFAGLRTIPSSKELLDIAFSRAKKDAMKVSTKLPKEIMVRRKETTRIETAGRTLVEKLQNVLEDMPQLDELPPLYKELADIVVGVQSLKKNLGALKWAAITVGNIAKSYSRRTKAANGIDEASNSRRSAYGRISSVIKQISGNLDYLGDSRSKLVKLPTFLTNVRTLVVAGYANVGKSSLVRQISSAKPEIASYPFTTKEIMVGHGRVEDKLYQVVDTPGLLDRPLKDRNKIELQAILALRYLANCIIFLIDPTGTCGYSLEKQVNLFREIEEEFPDTPKIVALNKIDLAEKDAVEKSRAMLPEVLLLSALTNEGVTEVLEAALLKAVNASLV